MFNYKYIYICNFPGYFKTIYLTNPNLSENTKFVKVNSFLSSQYPILMCYCCMENINYVLLESNIWSKESLKSKNEWSPVMASLDCQLDCIWSQLKPIIFLSRSFEVRSSTVSLDNWGWKTHLNLGFTFMCKTIDMIMWTEKCLRGS